MSIGTRATAAVLYLAGYPLATAISIAISPELIEVTLLESWVVGSGSPRAQLEYVLEMYFPLALGQALLYYAVPLFLVGGLVGHLNGSQTVAGGWGAGWTRSVVVRIGLTVGLGFAAWKGIELTTYFWRTKVLDLSGSGLTFTEYWALSPTFAIAVWGPDAVAAGLAALHVLRLRDGADPNATA